MKIVFITAVILALHSSSSHAVDFYSLTAHDAFGNVVPLEQHRGKVSVTGGGGCMDFMCAHA